MHEKPALVTKFMRNLGRLIPYKTKKWLENCPALPAYLQLNYNPWLLLQLRHNQLQS
ncbi:hypothetical protein IHE45_05G071600 [Dioscorea alata]|uniref:Uncharacterized protein n=1 Tax=Dioscorea alata TaxID=55571 RepID=A0ACB7W1W0_DIOAL|nr:hypothetical protein IHE45_05G071600 [Dioscorea alata]